MITSQNDEAATAKAFTSICQCSASQLVRRFVYEKVHSRRPDIRRAPG